CHPDTISEAGSCRSLRHTDLPNGRMQRTHREAGPIGHSRSQPCNRHPNGQHARLPKDISHGPTTSVYSSHLARSSREGPSRVKIAPYSCPKREDEKWKRSLDSSERWTLRIENYPRKTIRPVNFHRDQGPPASCVSTRPTIQPGHFAIRQPRVSNPRMDKRRSPRQANPATYQQISPYECRKYGSLEGC